MNRGRCSAFWDTLKHVPARFCGAACVVLTTPGLEVFGYE